ncbi:hypothetical protein B0H14DRAFT_3471096 [Mycena olivaceomarginata]|nr:hypothetical protein B0H14DRAFT_3471096 [Mycena olivaceomarginata]
MPKQISDRRQRTRYVCLQPNAFRPWALMVSDDEVERFARAALRAAWRARRQASEWRTAPNGWGTLQPPVLGAWGNAEPGFGGWGTTGSDWGTGGSWDDELGSWGSGTTW